MQDVQAAVLEALASELDCPVNLSDDLAALSIDSLAMAELALNIEKRLKIRLDEEVLEQRTVQDLVDYTQSLVDKQKKLAPS